LNATPAREKEKVMSTGRTQQRIGELEERAAKLRGEMQRLKQQEKEKRRKEEALRVRLVGQAVLDLVERGEWPRDQLMGVLDKALQLPKDRRLFGLPTDSGASVGSRSQGPAPVEANPVSAGLAPGLSGKPDPESDL
jgi:TolA-binding protein